MYLFKLLACLLAFQLTLVSAFVTKPALSKHALTGNDEEILLAIGDKPSAANQLEPSSVSRGDKFRVLSCGKEILPFGVYAIQSANYNEDHTMDYEDSTNCTYSLEAADPQGKLHFDCFYFQLEETQDCSADFLQINGEEKHCGKNLPKPIISDKLDIMFITNERTADKGFFCTVVSKESGAGCGGLTCGTHHLQTGTYTLLSKNHPDNYDVLQYCKWQLSTLNPHDNIEFTCQPFDIESYDGTCAWDWVRVNGERYCNASPPPSSAYLGPVVTVEYTTPNLPDKTRTGFKCTVSVEGAPAN